MLEDDMFHPFAGIYRTIMIPNNQESAETRLQELANSIKLVYASTSSATPRRTWKTPTTGWKRRRWPWSSSG
jgi:hypothetical protein